MLSDLFAGTATDVTLSHLRDPWGLRFETPAVLVVHVLVRGAARCAGQPLRPGDVALVRGAHDLTDPAGTTPGAVVDGPGRSREPHEPPDRAGDRWRLPGARSYGDALDAPTLLVHAAYLAQDPVGRRALAGFPAVLTGQAPAELLALLAEESLRDGPAQRAVLDRLVDLLVLTVLRGRRDVGLLSAAADPVVGPVLDLLHARPAQRWTVAALAERAGVSRATFARRFAQVVGSPPLRYLTDLRLDLAADLLRRSDRTLASIAAEVGFSDAFALSTAYRRRRGRPPSADRGSSTAR